MPTLIYRILPLAAVTVLAACDRGASPASAAAAGSASTTTAGTARDGDQGRAPAGSATAVRTATRPADACGWISAVEVAKIVGPLTGTPYSTDDGCVYPLPIDTATAHRNAQLLELRRKLEERSGKSDLPPLEPDTSAVIVDVQVYTAPAMGRGMAAAFAQMGHMLCDDSASASEPWCKAAERDTSPPTPLPGWDRTNDTTSRSFYGRVGHIGVDVTVHAAEVSHEQTVAIANRIREAIPDLPFPATRPSNPVGPDPCILLSVQEVEAVLGKLVVAPYRSDEETPLAMEKGKSCSYFTAGHHALVLTPTWEYGGRALELMRGVGGLVSSVAPELKADAIDTLEGDWEEAGTDAMTGQLYFLTGDRLLEVGYLVSSTDANGAARLARIATGRLGKGTTPQPAAASEVAGRSSGCPSAAAVGTAVAVAVTVVRADDGSPDWMTCTYELTGRYRGVILDLKTEPAARAETRFAELKEEVRSANGADAVPDRIAVGEGGWAYGSSSRSTAAAVAGGRVYRATMSYFEFGSIGDQRDAMVRVLKLAIH
jgi:hypothetical protein